MAWSALNPEGQRVAYLLMRDSYFIAHTIGAEVLTVIKKGSLYETYVSSAAWFDYLGFPLQASWKDKNFEDLKLDAPLYPDELEQRWQFYLMDIMFDLATILHARECVDILLIIKFQGYHHIFSSNQDWDYLALNLVSLATLPYYGQSRLKFCSLLSFEKSYQAKMTAQI
jgi:hypothetical protein